MKISLLNIFGFVFLLVLFQSCEKKNCLSAAGDTISEKRKMPVFQHIETYDHFKFYLQNDTVHSVRIVSGENLISNIETYVQNDTLIIKDNNTCNFLKDYPERKIYISVDTLKSMEVYGASDVFSIDTFHVHSFKLRFLSDIASCNLTVSAYVFQLQIWYSTGDFYVKGNTYASYLSANQTSFIYADSLMNKICYATNNSKGEIYVQAGKWFYYSIKNTGNIYYSGNPDTIIVQDHSGSGQLIKQN